VGWRASKAWSRSTG